MTSEKEVDVIEAPYLVWLKKEGFNLESNVPMESDSLVWTRESKYGAPKCSTNGKVLIEIVKEGSLFSMAVRASTPKYWGNAMIYGFDEDQLVRLGRQYEHRVVDAWREMSA